MRSGAYFVIRAVPLRVRQAISVPVTQRGLGGAVVCGAVLVLLSLAMSCGARERAGGNHRPAPAEYTRANELLAEGDTAGAIELLRAATLSDPRFGPAFLRLGALLAESATRLETDIADRLDAEQLLRRAFDLMGPDPEAYLAYGMLLAKRGMQTDALRAIDNALAEAERGRVAFPPTVLSRLHLTRGEIYERYWEEQQNRRPSVIWEAAPWIEIGTNPASMPAGIYAFHVAGVEGCVPLTAERAAGYCSRYADRLPGVSDRARMMAAYRAALVHDPGNVEAGIRLLGHIADEDEWEEYNAVAAALLAAAPNDPSALFFRGLGLHHVGRSDLAELVFRSGKELLGPDDLERYRDIGLLLRPGLSAEYAAMDTPSRRDVERMFFTITDPLHLTPVSERRMEHYSRVPWADLKFESQTAAVRGLDSDRGMVWVRFGKPERWTQFRPVGFAASWSGAPMPMAQLVQTSEYPSPFLLLEWRYAATPADLFAGQEDITSALQYVRNAGSRTATLSNRQHLHGLAPEFYRPATITAVTRYPHQTAVFRGDEPHLNRIEIYGRPPLGALEHEPGGELDAGFFLFDRSWHPLWESRRAVAVHGTVLTTAYAFNTHPGLYYYSLEARGSAPDSVPRPLARARLSLVAPGFPAGRVSLSSLLLADTLTPRPGIEMVTRRDDLHISPSGTMVFRPGEPVNIYFEVYGLAADEGGFANYRAELQIDSEDQPVSIFRRGGDHTTRHQWERIVRLNGEDGLVPEYLNMEVPPLRPGVYRIRITVTDLNGRSTAAALRDFIVYAGDPETLGWPPVWFDVNAVLSDAIDHAALRATQPAAPDTASSATIGSRRGHPGPAPVRRAPR